MKAMESKQPTDVGRIGHLLVAADAFPGTILLRAALGYLVVPAWSAVMGATASHWTLLPFFLAVLIAVRFAPVVIRRVVPFDKGALHIWLERRQVAKRYDSYQWQKLLWVALGLAAYIVQAGARFDALLMLTGFCFLSGASGFAIWEASRRRLNREGTPVRYV
jgi:hypothetical protein